jgi:low affinity Fe/Cu permease
MQAQSPPMQASFATLPSSKTKTMRSREASIFTRFARWAARQFGRSIAFTLAFLTIIVWAATGPLFGWSDTWQLVINTGTTIVTFLMVFIIQNTQNRDTEAIHLKLDELIRVNKAARNSLMSLEEQPDSEVEEVKSAFADLAATDKSPTREQKARRGKG